MNLTMKKLLASLIFCCGLIGCSSGVKTAISDEETFMFPQEFEETDVKWTKTSEPSDTELRHLSDYFENNPSLAEGSVVRGEPTLYTNSKKQKRFYWVRPGAEQLDWLFVQFKGNKVSLKEGRGSPLSN